ncbi:MAG: hypothetical protein L0Z62_47230 [Gemmataceae bacterium]|nr:hypothetical protein [Gemmataceae bacterium]
MFSAEDIQARLRQQPFRPFRIVASEGMQFDIRHPDLVFVGRRDLMVGFPDPDSPTVYDRVTRLALVHIVALEDLPAATPPGTGEDGVPTSP